MKNKEVINAGAGTNAAFNRIKDILEKARSSVVRAVNSAMVQAYWEIGKIIVEEDQKGKARAAYGSLLLKELSKRLSEEYGKGFDESNLRNIRQFYIMFPKCDALRHELTWTNYRLFLFQNHHAVSDKLKWKHYIKLHRKIINPCRCVNRPTIRRNQLPCYLWQNFGTLNSWKSQNFAFME